MESNKWLKELKAGDRVIVRYSQYSDTRYHTAIVEKITPKGFIKVDGTLYNNDDGWARGECLTKLLDWNDEKAVQELTKYTQQRYAADVRNKIANLRGSLTYEQAQQIAKIMGWE